MPVIQISEHVYAVSLGFVNVFLIEAGMDGWVLVDTGVPGSSRAILAGLQELGGQVQDLHHILITHFHGDHIGSLGAIKDASAAAVWMHAADATMVRQGLAARPCRPAPGLLYKILYQLTFARRGAGSSGAGVAVEHELQSDEILPLAGGIHALHTPGHTVGHLAFLLPQEGVLMCGDALTNWRQVGHPPIYEDFELGRVSQKRLAALEYRTLCCSHGRAIGGGALPAARARILQIAGT